jgi:tetratricopeptide (TPR) repeat protein
VRSHAQRRRSEEEAPKPSELGPHGGLSNAGIARVLARTPDATAEQEEPVTATGKDGATQWFDRAQLAYLAKNYVRAAECFRRAFALVPLPEFIYNEGSAYEKGGHYPAAANAYEHYLLLDPGAKEAKELIAKIKAWRKQGADPDALMDPEEDVAAAPEVTATGVAGASEWYDRASLAFQLGDFKHAYDCFVQAYDLKPAPEFVYNQAACLEKLGNTDAAVQAYERYLALAPKAKDGAAVRERIKKLRDGDLKRP